MTTSLDEYPFSELPEALVVDMLSYCEDISIKLSKSFSHLYNSKDDFRKELLNQSLSLWIWTWLGCRTSSFERFNRRC